MLWTAAWGVAGHLWMFFSAVYADTVISSDVTQNGGTLAVDPPVLLITDAVNDPTLTLTSGATAEWDGAVIIGGYSAQSGHLQLLNGSTLTTTGTGEIGDYGSVTVSYGNGYIALNEDTSGSALVSGSGSAWTHGTLYVGFHGSGELQVADGGGVYSDLALVGHAEDAVGVVGISGSGSVWVSDTLVVGNGGHGELYINAGAGVATETAYVGYVAGSTGLMQVSGEGTIWESELIEVGRFGNGELQIEDGGRVFAYSTTLGFLLDASGKLTVTGADSTLESESIEVGSFANGEMTVENGGAVYSLIGYVGYGVDASGLAIVTGESSVWISEGGMIIGEAGSGELRIEDGGLVSSYYGQIGIWGDSVSKVVVTGENSTWINVTDIEVTRTGSGELIVENGGLVSTRSLLASLSDLKGDGTIQAKGVVLDGVDLFFDADHGVQQTIAFGNGGQLELDADGTGILGAGYRGTGTLLIADGLVVTSESGIIGRLEDAVGTALVTGSGSRWQLGWSIAVGDYGTGDLAVEEGAGVSSYVGYIGQMAGSTGSVLVTGEGSEWTAMSIYVGYEGEGVLVIDDGGLVQTVNGTYIGIAEYATGSVTVSGAGSELAAGQEFVVGGYSTTESGGPATLIIEDGGIVRTGTLKVHEHGVIILNGGLLEVEHLDLTTGTFYLDSGTVDVFGTVTGDLAVGGNLVFIANAEMEGSLVNAGTVSPGDNPGSLIISGDFTQAGSSTLIMNIGGLEQGVSYDLVGVNGTLTLAGALEIVQADSFNPALGDSFVLFAFGNIVGTFDSIAAFSLDEGLMWDFSKLYIDGSVSISAVPEPAACAILLALLALGVTTALRRRRN